MHTKYEIQDSVIEKAICLDSEPRSASLEDAGCDETRPAAMASFVFQKGRDGPFEKRPPLRSDLSDFNSSMKRLQSCASTSTGSNLSPEILCSFECTGLSGAPVWVSSAPPKMIGRMREKLLEYHAEGAAPHKFAELAVNVH